jgi:ABC-type uncharacterized transport system substrate-binding protein
MPRSRLFYVGFLLASLGLHLSAHAKKTAVFVSKKIPAYQDVVAGFTRTLKTECITVDLQGRPEAVQTWLEQGNAQGLGLLLAIGPEAVQGIQRYLPARAPDLPWVYTMVLNPPEDAPRAGGVLMQLPLASQLQQVRQLFPGAKKIGVIYTPAYSLKLINEVRQLTEAQGFVLVPFPVEGLEDMTAVLPRITPETVDLLWSVLDRTVMNPAAMQKIIAYTAKARMPFVGLSEYHVEAGALAAFSVDFGSLGEQTARLAGRILKPDAQAFGAAETPREIITFINKTTQKKIGLTLPKVPNLRYKE